MKNILAVLSLFMFLYACKKEVIEVFEPGSQIHGFVTAIKKAGNSQVAWSGGGGASIDNNNPQLFGFNAYTVDEYKQIRESLSIIQLPLHPEKGKYVIAGGAYQPNYPFASYGRLISDGDVLDALYQVKEDRKSWVEILEIDSTTKIVKGRFDVRFEIKSKYEGRRGYPNEVHFDDGYFEVEIWK